MSENLSIDQALIKAKFHIKNNEIVLAKKLYKTFLTKFPKNTRIKKELASLENLNDVNLNPDQEVTKQLINLFNHGQFSSVIKQAQTLIGLYPKSLIILEIMGVSATKVKKFNIAIDAFKQIIELRPFHAEAYFHLANTYQDNENFEEAIKVYRKLISFKPDYFEAYVNMGNTFQDQGKFEEAIVAYKNCIKLKSDNVDAYYNMGIALKAQRKFDKAIESFKKVLSLKPDFVNASYNIGNILLEHDKLSEAIDFYTYCLKINPDFTEVYCNLGVILEKQYEFEGAIQYYKKSILLNPNYADAYCNMGISLQNIGEIDKAIAAYKKSIMLKPDFAEAHHYLSFSLLNRGYIKEGLNEYEWRWKSKNFSTKQRYFKKPLWDGTKNLKEKKLLLWCEQGIADTINWSSILSLLVPQTKQIILECQKKLIPLFKRSFPKIEVREENISLDKIREDFDFHLPMGSVYRCFTDEILKNITFGKYLVPDPDRVEFWKQRLYSLGKPPYVGISWKSSNKSPNRKYNYANLFDLLPILKLQDVTFINLQYKEFEDEISEIQKKFGIKIHNFKDLDHYNDIDDVAALVKALDVVVSTKVTLLSISAGVGTLTKLASWKQSTWNNVLWNPLSKSLNIYERNTLESWENTFDLISKDLSDLKKAKFKDEF